MAGRFILNILGTASAKPNQYRTSSAQLLQAAERLFLIDCAEGVQRSILTQNQRLREWSSKNNVQGVKRLSKTQLDAIFISHIHGDHMFGLFPLLSTMALNGRTKPLKIFGPNNLGPVLNFYKSYWGEKDPFETEFTPLKMKSAETVLEYADIRIDAFPLNHGIDTFGFIFREQGPCLFKKAPYAPRSYAYCSDTAPSASLAEYLGPVDLLYHEATYMAVDFRKASSRFHSTTADAARCALDCGASRLIVGHYSSSIKEEDIQGAYIEEVRNLFPDSVAANDGDIIELPFKLL